MQKWINKNGEIFLEEMISVGLDNRSFRYGDGIFETMRYSKGIIYFYEDHYFRAMGSLCMLRMDIPTELNMEFLFEQIIATIKSNSLEDKACRIRLQFSRKNGGLYTPTNSSVDYYIEVDPIESDSYNFMEEGLNADIFFDHEKAANELSSLKSNNAIIPVLASIFAQENNIDQSFIMNTNKEIIETQNSNIFLFKDDKVYVPGPTQGCVDGILRKQMIKILESEGKTIVEDKIRAYELNTAQEILVSNSISGIQYISRFREKIFSPVTAKNYVTKLETLAHTEPFSL
jgi:branched-chain amino acid aminotransferase